LVAVKKNPAKDIDWTFVDGGLVASFRDIITLTQLGNEDSCHLFINKIFNNFHKMINREGEKRNKIPLIDEYKPTFQYNVAKHCIYYFDFDPLSHHSLLETYQGKARLFQCYVKQDEFLVWIPDYSNIDDEGIPEFIQFLGYSAKVWANPHPPQYYPQCFLDAHAKYGGGKELSYSVYQEYINNIFELQKLVIYIFLWLIALLSLVLLFYRHH
jgi:hypothetical protein